MGSPALYQLTADVVLLLHLAFVGFVVLGLVLILAGRIARWSWVRNPWFRLIHLAAIIIVAAQAWLGRICPLTDIESALRGRAGETVYVGSFVSHWLQALLYYEAPPTRLSQAWSCWPGSGSARVPSGMAYDSAHYDSSGFMP
jgi:hypothetical protein